MEDVVLEKDDSEGATSQESVETEKQPETVTATTEEEKQPETSQEEPEVEIEGEKVTVAQLKEWREAAKNQKEWQKSNTVKAQQIAEDRKRLQQAEMLYDFFQKNPEKFQKIVAPEPARDFNTELETLYQQRPTEDPNEYWKWEQKKDRLIAEKAAAEAAERVKQQTVQEFSRKHNEDVVRQAAEKYKDKVSADEFEGMTRWIMENVRPKEGNIYDQKAFDMAYTILHGDKVVEEAKLNAVKSVARSIEKAKPASGEPGKTKPEKEPDSAEDDEFEQRVHERYPRLRK